MKYKEVTETIIACAYRVYDKMGRITVVGTESHS